MGINYRELPNGWLRITADNDGRRTLSERYRVGGYPQAEAEVAADIVGNGLDFVAPQHIGALTDSPIIAEGFHVDDDGEPQLAADAKVWWFPDYMVRDPWDILRRTGRVDLVLAA